MSAIEDNIFDRMQCLRSKVVSTFADIVFDRSAEGSVLSKVLITSAQRSLSVVKAGVFWIRQNVLPGFIIFYHKV